MKHQLELFDGSLDAESCRLIVDFFEAADFFSEVIDKTFFKGHGMKREQNNKACKAIMKAAIAMLKSDGYGYLAGKHLACGGWLDVYSYEPLETLVFGVQRVAKAIKPFLVEDASDVWEWRCFAPDGYAEFWSDGSAIKKQNTQRQGTDATETP